MYNDYKKYGIYHLNHRIVIVARTLSEQLAESGLSGTEFIKEKILPNQRGLSPHKYSPVMLGNKKVHIIYSGLEEDVSDAIVSVLFLVDLIHLELSERYQVTNFNLISEYACHIPDRFCFTTKARVTGKSKKMILGMMDRLYPLETISQFDADKYLWIRMKNGYLIFAPRIYGCNVDKHSLFYNRNYE